jgi:hypothetical protein
MNPNRVKVVYQRNVRHSKVIMKFICIKLFVCFLKLSLCYINYFAKYVPWGKRSRPHMLKDPCFSCLIFSP